MQKGSAGKKLNNYDSISVTAYRIIIMFNLLLEQPCNDEDINNKLNETLGDSRNLSKDTICIYLNTLRALGCDISRPTKKNGYKYILNNHPFKLSLSVDEMDTLLEIRKYISIRNEWKVACEFDVLISKLLEDCDSQTIDFFNDIKNKSMVREINSSTFVDKIYELEEHCNNNRNISLIYDSPNSGEKVLTLKAEKISLENGAFYLWGYNEESDTNINLRIDKITNIKIVSLSSKVIKQKSVIVRYCIRGFCPMPGNITEHETIIEKNDDEIIIEEEVFNEFRFFQKVLSYGDKCIIISPVELKNQMKSTLNNMYNLYIDCEVQNV